MAGTLRLLGFETEERQQPVDLARERASAVPPLQCDFEVLADRQTPKHARHLELDRQAAVNARERFQRRDILASEEDIAAARMVLSQNQPEQRALAGAVGADQAMDFAGFEREIDRVGDVQAAEMLVQTAKFEERHQASPFPRRAVSRACRFMTASTSPFGAIRTVSTNSTPMNTSAYWLP